MRLLLWYDKMVSAFGIYLILGNQIVEARIGDFLELNQTDDRIQWMLHRNVIFHFPFQYLIRAIFALYKMRGFVCFDSVGSHFIWAMCALNHVLSLNVCVNRKFWHDIWAMRTSVHFVNVPLIIALLHLRFTKATVYQVIAIVTRFTIAIVIAGIGVVTRHFVLRHKFNVQLQSENKRQ